MLRDCMPEQARPEDPLHTCNIMTYELGYVIHDLVYADHKDSWNDMKGVKVRLANAKINHADLITQCRVLAEQMGWPWQAQIADGEERFRERMKEIEEKRL